MGMVGFRLNPHPSQAITPPPPSVNGYSTTTRKDAALPASAASAVSHFAMRILAWRCSALSLICRPRRGEAGATIYAIPHTLTQHPANSLIYILLLYMLLCRDVSLSKPMRVRGGVSPSCPRTKAQNLQRHIFNGLWEGGLFSVTHRLRPRRPASHRAPEPGRSGGREGGQRRLRVAGFR